MSLVSVVFACLGLAAAAVPHPGASVGLAFGCFAAILGFYGFRCKQRSGSYRLWSAAAVGIAGIAVTLCSARLVVTMLAIDRLAGIAGN